MLKRRRDLRLWKEFALDPADGLTYAKYAEHLRAFRASLPAATREFSDPDNDRGWNLLGDARLLSFERQADQALRMRFACFVTDWAATFRVGEVFDPGADPVGTDVGLTLTFIGHVELMQLSRRDRACLLRSPRAEIDDVEFDRASDGRLELRVVWSAGPHRRGSFALRFDDLEWAVTEQPRTTQDEEVGRRRAGSSTVERALLNLDFRLQLSRLSWRLQFPVEELLAPLLVRWHERRGASGLMRWLGWRPGDSDRTHDDRWRRYREVHLPLISESFPPRLRELAEWSAGPEWLHDAYVTALDSDGDGTVVLRALCVNPPGGGESELTVTFTRAELLGTSFAHTYVLTNPGAGLDYTEFDIADDGRFEIRISTWSGGRQSAFGVRFASVEFTRRPVPDGTCNAEAHSRAGA